MLLSWVLSITLLTIKMSTTTSENKTYISDYDALDVVCLAHAALAQDSPKPQDYYLTQILNLMFAYLSPDQRRTVESYLAEKKYLPEVKIQLAK